MESRRVGIGLRCAAPTEPPPDVARHEIDGEQVIDPVQPAVALQFPQVGVRHQQAQRSQALVGRSAVARESLGVPGGRLKEQLAERDLDPELALRRNVMSRKSMDSAPRSPCKVAEGLMSPSSTP